MKRQFSIAAALVLLMSAAMGWGQDFSKDYPLGPGGTISIANVSGNIQVRGYEGAAVRVEAVREGSNADQIEIVDQSTPDHVSLKVQYPRGSYINGHVRFLIQVPHGARYLFDSLTTASGDIEVSDVTGEISANTASGDITIGQVEGNVQAHTASGDVDIEDVAGSVSAHTASGDIEARLARLGEGDHTFSSASGDVSITVPSQANAQVEMSTASGSLEADFPLTIEDRDGPGKKAFGMLGSGGSAKLKITSASGDIELRK